MATSSKPVRNPNFLSATAVLKRIEKIEALPEDILQKSEWLVPQRFTSEHELFRDVLTAIATGNCTNPRAMARLAISTITQKSGVV